MYVDPIKAGLKNGWQHIDTSTLTESTTYEADVIVVGTGAGGGVTAEVLSQSGLNVLVVEMGSFKSSSDFDMEERHSYPNLYQESAARKTKNKVIGILQGRTVGGSTAVNWTTSIRTPKHTQQFWKDEFDVKLDDEHNLNPYFEHAEKRLNIHQWPVPPNANNETLKKACEKLGWEYTVIKRNVKGCANLGYCGMGCPINAKQSMLVTTVPSALQAGARLLSHVYVQSVNTANDKVTEIQAIATDKNFQRRATVGITLKAKHFVLSAGAIGTPSILLRSNVVNPSGRLGKHTYLHPTVISGALMPEMIYGHSGAPQSIYSDEFVWKYGVDGKLGFKLEVPPIHPVLIGSKLMGFGEQHAEFMHKFNEMQITIALLRDGFHPQSQGGTVQIDKNGDPVLDYPTNDFLWDGVRRALQTCAEIQFAAGAKKVFPNHNDGIIFNSWKEAKAGFKTLPMGDHQTTVASAHVMGGCNMGEDPRRSVVNSFGEHHQLENLSIHDGSTLPTSLGANPQLTIYGLTYRNAKRLALRLGGKPTY